jgi:hypothetical protein
VSAYGPGCERAEDERERFWQELSECLDGFSANEQVIVMGDLNARVGDREVDGVIGKYGVSGMNESGECLIELYAQHELVVGNTWFRKKDINKYTLVKEDGGRVVDKALMDHVLDVHVYSVQRSEWRSV